MKGSKAASTRAAHARKRISTGAMVALALAVPACGDGSGATAPGDVLARVNKDEITVSQMKGELARLGLQGDGAAERVLDELVDRQLLIQEAIETKLDRDPQILQSIERARRQILSEAVLERGITVQRPGREEVQAFYLRQPDLFERRRIYSFRDYVIDQSLYSEALRGKLKRAKSRADVVAVLKAADIPFRESASARAAEELPLDELPTVAAMKQGEVFSMTSGQTVVLMQLTDHAEQPVTLEQATPYIEQFLMNMKREQLAERKLKELRAAARIAYVAPARTTRNEQVDVGSRPQAAVVPAAGSGDSVVKQSPNGR